MPKDEKDILEIARKRFRESYDYDREDREEAIDDLKFAWNFKGYQWPDDVRAQREEDPNGSRPCLVINKIPEKIDLIEGEFRQARPNAEVIPVDSQADPVIAEIMGGILKHIDYDSCALDIYAYAYSYLLHCGRCAWRVNTKKSKQNPFDKELCIESVKNPFAIYDDPYRKKVDGSDRRYLFETEMMPKDEFEKKHDKDVESWGFEASDEEELWWDENSVRIARYWYVETEEEKVYQVDRVAADGQIIRLIITEGQKQETDTVIDETTQEKRKVYHCKLGGKEILEGPTEWKGEYIPVINIVGKALNIDGKQRSRGMVRHAKDPQRMLNYWVSTNTEQLALSPKAPYIITPAMLEHHKDQWDTAGVYNWPYLVANIDPKAPGLLPKREVPPLASSGYSQEIMRLEHDIMSAMGVYQASTGDKSNEISGVAIAGRQRQANISTTPFVDAMSAGITMTAKIEIGMIPYVYDTERIMRIRGEDDTEKMIPINARKDVPVNNFEKKALSPPRPGITDYINDLTVGKYDVRVKMGASYTTQREEAFDKLFNLLAKAPNLIPATIDLLVKNLDMPGSQEFVARVEKLVPANLKEDQEQIDPAAIAQQVQAQMMQMKEFKDQMLQEHDAMLAEREQMRKEFETKINAIAKIAEAEAREPGQNMGQYKNELESVA